MWLPSLVGQCNPSSCLLHDGVRFKAQWSQPVTADLLASFMRDAATALGMDDACSGAQGDDNATRQFDTDQNTVCEFSEMPASFALTPAHLPHDQKQPEKEGAHACPDANLHSHRLLADVLYSIKTGCPPLDRVLSCSSKSTIQHRAFFSHILLRSGCLQATLQTIGENLDHFAFGVQLGFFQGSLPDEDPDENQGFESDVLEGLNTDKDNQQKADKIHDILSRKYTQFVWCVTRPCILSIANASYLYLFSIGMKHNTTSVCRQC